MSLALAAVAAALLGSLHCAAMCGPLGVLLAGPGRRTSMVFAWHAGRLIAYAGLGALAGALGGVLDRSLAIAGVQRAALILSASALVLLGGLGLCRRIGWAGRRPALRAPRAISRFAASLRSHAANRPPNRRAFWMGLLTPLLPCGWLYAWIVAAAGTGSAWAGAALMLAFGAGTVPGLTVVFAALRRLGASTARRVPALGDLALVASGLVLLALRLGGGHPPEDREHPDAVALGGPQATLPLTPDCCHGRD